MTSGGWCGFLDVQGPMQLDNEQNPHQYPNFIVQPQRIEVVSPCRDVNVQEYDQQRMRWTDTMVKLLITAVSYLGEVAFTNSSGGGRKSSLRSLKKGKWRVISKVIGERGYHVSPQQCEDKFNDLNKKYKRMNCILGRSACCKVFENPEHLDSMDLSDKEKGDVRKMLCCKQLFYKEMWSLHNGNHSYIRHDLPLQQSLLSTLKSRGKNEPYLRLCKPPDEFDKNEDAENGTTSSQVHALNEDNEISGKRANRGKQHEVEIVANSLDLVGCTEVSDTPQTNAGNNVNHVSSEVREGEQVHNQWIVSHSLRLAEQRLHIQAQILKLEQQKIKWLSSSMQEDRELEKMWIENEHFKLWNLKLALQLKHWELRADYK